MPDLVIANITTDPSPLVKGQLSTVHVEVKNEGSGQTMATCWVGLYIDRPPAGDPDQLMFSPPLAVDESVTVVYTIDLTDIGYHAFTAWADFLQTIPEEDEANNQHSVSIFVAEPTSTPTTTSTPLPTSTPTPTSTPLPTPTTRPGEMVYLVYNGDFEGEFISREGLGEVADEWAPFVETENKPQFLRGKERTKGQSSQRIWSDYVPFRAGIYQRVTGVTPGQNYIARAEMLSIFGVGDTPVPGMNMGKQIGLDPHGGEDASSSNVIWSDVSWEDRAWQEGERALWVSAIAEADAVTLFIRVDNVYGGHNDLFYIDEVTLHSSQATPTAATQTPSPTATVTPPPSSTATFVPLETLTPSATPLPLVTATSTPVLTPTQVNEEQPSSSAGSEEAPTPTPTSMPTRRPIGRLVPILFVLALAIIVILIAAIMWLQPADR